MHICFSSIDYFSENKVAGGGITSYLDSLSPYLVKMGHKVSIVGPGKLIERYKNKFGVNIYLQPLGSLHWFFYRLKFPPWFYLFIRELEWSYHLYKTVEVIHKNHKIDLIESHEVGCWYLIRNRFKLPPIVIRLHGSQFLFRLMSDRKISLIDKSINKWQFNLINKSSAISIPSNFHYLNYIGSIKTQYFILHNPINDVYLNNSSTSSSNNDRFNLLYVGRIDPVKGIFILLSALQLLKLKFPTINLTIVGAKQSTLSNSDINKAIKNYKLEGNLTFLGHCSLNEMTTIYAQFKILIVPSNYETFGINILEAMASGLYVISTDVGIYPELLNLGAQGTKIKRGDYNRLALEITNTLLMSELELNAKIKINKSIITSNFNPEKISELLIENINKLKLPNRN
jgi:glycosyltransferase involved in cell wall biosynthesis